MYGELSMFKKHQTKSHGSAQVRVRWTFSDEALWVRGGI
jgi:hypothetical protein